MAQKVERKSPNSDLLLKEAETTLKKKVDTAQENKRRILQRCGCL